MKSLLPMPVCLVLVTVIQAIFIADVNATPADAPGEASYLRCCASCHDTGIGNAQLLGDRKGWQARLSQGENTLILHSLNGFVGPLGIMPARGQCPELTDAEVTAAVHYIITKTR
jgi:cytochrome c5